MVSRADRLLEREVPVTDKTKIEHSKAVVRRFVDAMSRRDIEAAAGLVAEGLVNHAAIPEAQGRAGMRVIAAKLFSAFPDAAYALEEMFAEGDRVCCRTTFTGTHTGALEFVRMPLAATGRTVRNEAIHVYRVEGDSIVEHWACRDDMAMLRQLGVLGAKAAA